MDVISQSMKYYRKIWPAMILIVVLHTIATLISLALPQLTQLIIDRALYPALGQPVSANSKSMFDFVLSGIAETDYVSMVIVLISVMSGLLLISYINHYTQWNTAHLYNRKVSDRIRHDAFKKYLNCSPRVVHAYTSGDMMNILNNDIDNVMDLYQHRFIMLYVAIVNCVGSIVIMMFTAPIMAIIPMALSIVTFFLSVSYNKALRKCYSDIRESNVDLNSCIQENINGVRIIRSFATEQQEMDKFEKKNIKFKDTHLSLAKTAAKYNMFFRLNGYAMSVGSMIVGIILAARGDITVGQFTTFTTYVNALNGSIISIASNIGTLQNCMIAGRRLFGFMNTPDGIPHERETLDVPEKPNYKLNSVGMNFTGNNVLENIDLDLPYGKKVGFMGKTGCGKSVIMRLLNRFYDCTEGSITIDGRDIAEYKLEEVRRAASFVSQDVFLFSDTVANNIAFYDESKDMGKIEHFASLAKVDKFIPRLSDGFDTVVGERGLGLSGGQKQRVSIARALYKEAPVLLLDDCTSALDYQTEGEIIDNISENYGDKTLIIASNRATSVSFCDEIIYMEDGKIIERGSHDELMALCGRYYSIYTAQTGSFKEEVA